MGLILFIVFGVVVFFLIRYIKRNNASNQRDKTAWDKTESEALRNLKQRLDTGDITQEEYDQKVKEIERDA